jgi:hypothetical protein
VGDRRGSWCDFATGQYGDALDLVREALDRDMVGAISWSCRWLGIEDGEVAVPKRPASAPTSPKDDPNRWRHVWAKGEPIAATLAAKYLTGRGLAFDDPRGEVLRFHSRCARMKPGSETELERIPAMLALLCNITTGKPTGIVRTYLRDDGADRLRDAGGRRVTGKVRGSAVMLSPFDDVTLGLGVVEGVETGLAILQNGWAPIWAMTGAGNLAQFPVLNGIEALTVFADQDEPGLAAAKSIARRWRQAGREVSIVAPPQGDWCDEDAP